MWPITFAPFKGHQQKYPFAGRSEEKKPTSWTQLWDDIPKECWHTCTPSQYNSFLQCSWYYHFLGLGCILLYGTKVGFLYFWEQYSMSSRPLGKIYLNSKHIKIASKWNSHSNHCIPIFSKYYLPYNQKNKVTLYSYNIDRNSHYTRGRVIY